MKRSIILLCRRSRWRWRCSTQRRRRARRCNPRADSGRHTGAQRGRYTGAQRGHRGGRHRRDRDGGRLLQHPPDRCHRGRPRRDPPGEGPFTVFARPTRRSQRRSEGTLDSLLADPEALKQVLLYHVAGEVTADQVAGPTSADSVEGSRSRSRSGWLRLPQRHRRGRRPRWPPIGVIHVIDSVILPPTD